MLSTIDNKLTHCVGFLLWTFHWLPFSGISDGQNSAPGVLLRGPCCHHGHLLINILRAKGVNSWKPDWPVHSKIMNAELLPSLPALPIIWDSSQISAGMPVGEIQKINGLWENVLMNNDHWKNTVWKNTVYRCTILCLKKIKEDWAYHCKPRLWYQANQFPSLNISCWERGAKK